MTKQKIISIVFDGSTNQPSGSQVDLLTVPAGASLAVTSVIFKTRDVNGDVTQVGGQGIYRLQRASDEAQILEFEASGLPAGEANLSQTFPVEGDAPVIPAEDRLVLYTDTPDEGSFPSWSVEVIGILSGVSVSSGKMYTDVDAVGAYLGVTISEEDEEKVEEWIRAMSITIDNLANRVIQDDATQTFSYDGDGSNLLIIKDCVDISAVVVGSRDVTAHIAKYPANKGYTSRIALKDGYRFEKGLLNVSVTAIQAMHEEVPADIKLACTILVAGIYNKSEGAVGKSEKIGDYSVTYAEGDQETDFANAKRIISSYRRIAL